MTSFMMLFIDPIYQEVSLIISFKQLLCQEICKFYVLTGIFVLYMRKYFRF